MSDIRMWARVVVINALAVGLNIGVWIGGDTHWWVSGICTLLTLASLAFSWSRFTRAEEREFFTLRYLQRGSHYGHGI